MNLFSRFYYNLHRWYKSVKLFLIISGPGIIVMLADNDAGGITTYAATGAKYGYHLIWFLVLLLPVAYFVQEMTARLGIVTKRGHAESVFDRFGAFWGWFSLVDLLAVNWLTLVTEFVGMTAALMIFHIPAWLTVVIVSVVMMIMVMQGRYWTWEKVALLFCIFNLIYIPCAFMVKPEVSEVLRQGIVPNFPGGFNQDIFFFMMANIGTTIAPWMIYFQQSAVVDKGVHEKDIPWSKMDTLVGSIFTVLIAIFIVIVTGTVLVGKEIESAAQASQIIMGMNQYVGTFLAIGLFDAGFLGAICISLASSWAFGEVFGWAHSLNVRVKEAPWFYVTYFLTITSAGAVVLIPKAPLVLITLFVQLISVTLLPAALVFLILLLNDAGIMGKYKNTPVQNAITLTIILGIIGLSTAYAVSLVFPGWFH